MYLASLEKELLTLETKLKECPAFLNDEEWQPEQTHEILQQSISFLETLEKEMSTFKELLQNANTSYSGDTANYPEQPKDLDFLLSLKSRTQVLEESHSRMKNLLETLCHGLSTIENSLDQQEKLINSIGLEIYALQFQLEPHSLLARLLLAFYLFFIFIRVFLILS